jgi:RNA polymerase sigma-70 factor (ECF subfamily)
VYAESLIAPSLSYPLALLTSQPRRTVALDHRITEREWIDATLHGDEQAFRRIVDSYVDEVSRTVTGMLGPGPEIDDVVQEVFIKLHRSLASFRGEASLKTYVVRMAINKSLDALRKRKRSRWMQPFSPDDPWEPAADEVSDAEITDRERHASLRKAVNRLPEGQRAVVVLRLIEDYSTEETSRILDIPYGTVLSRLKRGVEKLKKELGNTSGWA